jgi:putative peptidoglycan lipid II flippase
MNLLKAASTVSLLTLASRITGLVRDQLIAATFGAGAATDAFNVAFRIPNLLRRLFAEGAFSQAFVPILATSREAQGDEVTRRLVDAVATVLGWTLLAVSLLGIVAAPAVVWAIASGLKDFDAAVLMTRWMFPYIFCMSLVALSAGVLNTWRRFAVPAATPVLLNLAVIGSAWGLAPWFAGHGIPPIQALAVGVMIGGVLQLVVQVPALRRIGCMPRIGLTPARVREAWHHPGVRHLLRQMAPALLGVSMAQFSLIINTQIASHLAVGSVSWLEYASRLMEFPTALLGVAIGVVLLPRLSSARARADDAGFSAMLDWGLRLIVMLALPCAVALVVFPEPLVAALFQRGAFSANDVDQTVRALMGYGVGLIGLIGVKVLAPAFYARQDVRTPVRIAVKVMFATQAANLVLVPWLGHAGLALSIGLGALLNAGMLGVGLFRLGVYRPQVGWVGFGCRVLMACILLGSVLAWGGARFDWVAMREHEALRLGWLAALLGGVALLYFGALALMGINLRQFARSE